MAEQPEDRISARDALAWFNTIRMSLDEFQLKWRLRGRDEPVPVRVVLDTLDIAKQALQKINWYLLQ